MGNIVEWDWKGSGGMEKDGEQGWDRQMRQRERKEWDGRAYLFSAVPTTIYRNVLTSN